MARTSSSVYSVQVGLFPFHGPRRAGFPIALPVGIADDEGGLRLLGRLLHPLTRPGVPATPVPLRPVAFGRPAGLRPPTSLVKKP